MIVRFEEDIYNYEKRLEGVLNRVKNSTIVKENKTKILEFYQECLAQGLSRARVIKYLDTLERTARLLKKPFKRASKNDIAELIRWVESQNYSEWTKHDYKVIFKIFYRWLRKTEGYPEEVRWIKTGTKKNNTLPEELLTEEEVKRMTEVASNPRDKALILVLYESGCRIGEILSLKIRNVQFDGYGAQLIVHGKTGMRRVRIVASAPKLAIWLDNHPLKENLDAPLWVSNLKN